MADTRALRSRWLRRGLGVAAVALAGVAVHDGRKILRIKRVADGAEVLAHDLTVGEGLGEPLELVVLGDSAAAGHGIPAAADAMPQRIGVQLAKASGRRVAVRSLAVSGATTQDVLRFQAPQLRRRAADIVVINVGVNDALSRQVDPDLTSHTLALIDAVRRYTPGGNVIFVETPDLSNAPGIPWTTGQLVKRRCRRVRALQRDAARQAGVPLVELPDVLDRGAFGVDGFHPGPVGQDALARRVAAELLFD
ncbi:MAG: SGNH/GDSL hydrolase family protein [Nitriliruptorales bacterium]|nr:SGNH/GDSL hydrolase family protein [Nitriliruptorales bacterium]